MLVHIANNKSKMNPVYIKQSENSKSNSNSGNTVSMTYDVSVCCLKHFRLIFTRALCRFDLKVIIICKLDIFRTILGSPGKNGSFLLKINDYQKKSILLKNFQRFFEIHEQLVSQKVIFLPL